MADQMPSELGRHGQYRILGTAGRSHWGWLYRAHDRILERDVLITALSPTEADPESRHRFGREARALARLAPHPNIIEVVDLGEDEGMLFMVFKGLEGKSLLELMNAGMKLKSSLPVILQVLDGLAAMHDRIIHCDIKPAHIFVSNEGCAKITDFWLANLVSVPRLSFYGQTPPTLYARFAPPYYMSPELVRGEAYDGRTDLFSVGCILYELVTGQKAFGGESLTALLLKITNEEPEMGLIPIARDWQRLRGVIAHALQKKPEDRHPDAGAMRADLTLALEELGDSADWTPPPSAPAAPRLH